MSVASTDGREEPTAARIQRRYGLVHAQLVTQFAGDLHIEAGLRQIIASVPPPPIRDLWMPEQRECVDPDGADQTILRGVLLAMDEAKDPLAILADYLRVNHRDVYSLRIRLVSVVESVGALQERLADRAVSWGQAHESFAEIRMKMLQIRPGPQLPTSVRQDVTYARVHSLKRLAAVEDRVEWLFRAADDWAPAY